MPLSDADLSWGESLDAAFLKAIVDRLTVPIRTHPAFKLGLVNAQGRMLREPIDAEERRAFSFVDRIAFMMKANMGSKTMLLYNRYRQARLDPVFIRAASRAVSLRFTRYHDLNIK